MSRGLSVELYSLPPAGNSATFELRPDPETNVFDGFSSWKLDEVECEAIGDSPESLVLQSQEKLREHSTKRTTGSGVAGKFSRPFPPK